MRLLSLAILWLFTCGFFSSIGVILTAMVLTTIAMLDFVHEFVFYGASVLAGALIATVIARKVHRLQACPTHPQSLVASPPKTSTAKEPS